MQVVLFERQGQGEEGAMANSLFVLVPLRKTKRPGETEAMPVRVVQHELVFLMANQVQPVESRSVLC